MSEQQENTQEKGAEEAKPQGEAEQAFTQADVDRIVSERIQRERAKFADYDDLKAKAGEARTAEERIAELEERYQAAESARLRADVASRYSIPAEDRDLFLTGTDEDTLVAQARRLAERDTRSQNTSGNYVPREGTNPRLADDPDLEVVRGLFGSTT